MGRIEEEQEEQLCCWHDPLLSFLLLESLTTSLSVAKEDLLTGFFFIYG